MFGHTTKDKQGEKGAASVDGKTKIAIKKGETHEVKKDERLIPVAAMEGKMKLLHEVRPETIADMIKMPITLQDLDLSSAVKVTALDQDTVKALAEHLHELFRHGDKNTARSFLQCFNKLERKRIVSCKVKGKTALFSAVTNNLMAAMSYLIEECGGEVDQHSEGNDDTTNKLCTGSALAYAASTNNLEAAQILVNYGASVNAPTSTGLTPALCACFKGDPEMLKYLIEAGGDINIPDHNGFTCLMHAYMHSDAEITALLLANGAQINSQCREGMATIHYAAQSNNNDLMRLLLKQGADLNLKTSCGNTPLHLAIEKSHLDMVHQLLEAGADPYTRNKFKEDSFLYAVVCGDGKILKYLAEKHKSQKHK